MLIQLPHPSPVRRHGREVLQIEALADERLLRAEAREQLIHPALIADGGRQTAADVTAAERPRDVGGVDLHEIGQGQDLLVQRAAERLGELLRLLRPAEQVGPRHVSHQQRTA